MMRTINTTTCCRRLSRLAQPIPLGWLCLTALLGLAPADDGSTSTAPASADAAVVVPTSVFVGLWALLGILTGAGVGCAVWMAWRLMRYRRGHDPTQARQRSTAFGFYAMVVWSALCATATDVVFKLLAAYRLFFADTLTQPHALRDWQFLPGLNLPQTFLVMCVASFIALLIVRRLAKQTDIIGNASVWAFSAATGVLISILVTMASGLFFPALDFWRVPGAWVWNFADDRRLVNLADLIGYLGAGLVLIAVIFGWRHYRKYKAPSGQQHPQQ
ncbi:MAG: hypothetical protein EPN21_09990 [Methylococcaceae bacterium]|nr:MAG: hypothetical protein EPN21_09990 [Methylococcaceae bacterium]